MNESFSIGVAVPTYNRPDMVRNLLASVPAGYPIYVSDNGGFIDADFFRQNKNITIAKTASILPPFANWNRAISGVVSDYVVIPSDDDLFLDNAFSIIEDEIIKNPDVEVFFFGHNNIDGNNKIISSWVPARYQKLDPPFGFDLIKFGVDARMPSIIFKKSLLDRIGCFDEKFTVTAGDSDLIQRAVMFGKSLFVPRVIACYRIWSKGSTTQTISSDRWLQEIEVWADKIACIAETELQKTKVKFNKEQFRDEIYARNLISGVDNKLRSEGGKSARSYIFNHKWPSHAKLLTRLRLLKQLLKTFIRLKMVTALNSNKTLLNIVVSVVAKLATSVATVLSVPILLKILGVERYGAWVTLTSMLTWLTICDFGMGFGLKNKVTRHLAAHEDDDLHHYVIGCIQFSMLVSVVLTVGFFIAVNKITILKSNDAVSVFLYLPYILTFPLTISAAVLQGARKVGFQSILGSVGSIYWLLLLLTIHFLDIKLNTSFLALLYAASFVLQNALNYYFSSKIIPLNFLGLFSKSYINKALPILSVGIRFLLLQVASIILFSIGNYLVYTNLSAADTALFDSINKLYLFGIGIFNMAISVFWPEFTHSLKLNDRGRSNRLFNALILISLAFSISSFILAYAVPLIVNIWTKGILKVTVRQALPFALLVSIQSFSYCGAVILNVVEAVRGQIILAVIAALLMVPVSKWFFAQGTGIGSIPLASAILTFPSLFYCLYAGAKIIRGGSHVG